MIKYKYRFKTEQEFVNEFGEEWRHSVDAVFPTSMDYLLGKEFEIKYYKRFINEYGEIKSIAGWLNVPKITGIGQWNVSQDMLIKFKIGVDYNEKKILVYD